MQKKSIKIFPKKGFDYLVRPYMVCMLGCMMAFWSCKVEQQTVDGSYVSSVDHESIHLEDGRSIAISSADNIYYLARHAEKDTVAGDPDLTAIGYERAGELARIFKSARIDEVYTTMYMRTLMTADSVSRSKGMSMKTYDPKALKAFAEKLKNIDDQKRFLIVGHSNTTPVLSNHIHGAEELESFDEKDYDDLIVVVQSENKPSQLHQLKYKPQINKDK